jgi:hypothetical protein
MGPLSPKAVPTPVANLLEGVPIMPTAANRANRLPTGCQLLPTVANRRQPSPTFWEVCMTTVELMALRGVLADRRIALLDRLAVDAADADRSVDPGFLRLLSDLHTTIAAVDAALAETVTTGDV